MKFKKIQKKVIAFWDWLPKEGKVAVYMFGAVVLDQLAKDITAELFTFIPVTYRLTFFNLLEVILVEMSKRFQEYRKKG